MQYLEFEKDLEQLDKNLEELKYPFNEEGGLSSVNNSQIDELENKIKVKIDEIYSNLDGWKKTKIARHENRPKAEFYISSIFENFQQVSGDRNFGEDDAAITGFAKINGESVLVIGQEKGNDTQSRIKRNFGMMRPEGYRKTIRLMNLANKFNIPIISFVDTPGAYPGVGAEERGQAEAIAKSIECCMSLNVPTLAVVIGEGGSGGAIALASSNKVIMLENAIYSVISPEGCATILWRDPKRTLEAAKAMKLSSKDLLELKVIDEIVAEPIGGAHRDRDLILDNVRRSITNNLNEFENMSGEEIFSHRKNKFLSIGRTKGFVSQPDNLSVLNMQKNKLRSFIEKFFNAKIFLSIFVAAIVLFSYLVFFL